MNVHNSLAISIPAAATVLVTLAIGLASTSCGPATSTRVHPDYREQALKKNFPVDQVMLASCFGPKQGANIDSRRYVDEIFLPEVSSRLESVGPVTTTEGKVDKRICSLKGKKKVHPIGLKDLDLAGNALVLKSSISRLCKQSESHPYEQTCRDMEMHVDTYLIHPSGDVIFNGSHTCQPLEVKSWRSFPECDVDLALRKSLDSVPIDISPDIAPNELSYQ